MAIVQTQAKPEVVYFGKIDAMIAEVAAHDMGKAWFKQNGYRYAVLPLGAVQFQTDYFATKTEAKSAAKETAESFNCKIAQV